MKLIQIINLFKFNNQGSDGVGFIINKKPNRNDWAFMSWRTDLNRRPADYKSAALPAELRQHLIKF